MSPRCISCSGLRDRLPGEPFISLIEKLAVVGEIPPPEDTDLLCPWRKLPSDSAGVGEGGDLDRIDGSRAFSSCINNDMLFGGIGKTEEAALRRFLRRDVGAAFSEWSGG
jgi:hypothetical protein